MTLHYLDCSCNALLMTIMLPVFFLWTTSMFVNQGAEGAHLTEVTNVSTLLLA